MMVAHLGVAVFVFGVTMVKTYEIERDVKMGPGDSTEIAGYTFTCVGVQDVQGPNYQAVRGTHRGHAATASVVATLQPEKRIYRVQSKPMTEAAIDSRLTRDLYVSLGEPLHNGAWIVRVYVQALRRPGSGAAA